MQLNSNLILTTLTALLAAAPTTAAPAANLNARGPTDVVTFTLSPEFNTCTVNPTTTTVPFGQACGTCKPLAPSQKSISVTQLERRCRITVYNTADCSDAGIVSGTAGCWSPDGGILAYRVDCPWYFPGPGEPKACDATGSGGDTCN